MSTNNDDNSGAIFVFAFIGAALMVAAALIFAVLSFLALVMTIVSLFAWNRPVQIFDETVQPEVARAFVKRGIAGAVILPAFGVFCSVLFDFQVDQQVWPYLFIGGYSLGSVGIEIMRVEEAEQNHAASPRQIEIAPKPKPPVLLPPKTEAEFQFASWDDEEDRQ